MKENQLTVTGTLHSQIYFRLFIVLIESFKILCDSCFFFIFSIFDLYGHFILHLVFLLEYNPNSKRVLKCIELMKSPNQLI